MQVFSGFEYLLIDLANQFGLDKEDYDVRLNWAQQQVPAMRIHATPSKDRLDEAEEPALLMAAWQSVHKALNLEPIGHMVGFDACASGLQIMAAVTGCIETAKNTGLIGNKRADIYGTTTTVMNALLKQHGVTVTAARKDVKTAQMTHFYCSKKEPRKIFGENTPELKAFYRAQEIVAPGPVKLLPVMEHAWQPHALEHSWVLPDGFNARVKVMQDKDVKVEIDELNHATFTHRIQVNEGEFRGISLPANIIHSIDGFIVREMHRRCNYDPKQIAKALDLLQKENERRNHTRYEGQPYAEMPTTARSLETLTENSDLTKLSYRKVLSLIVLAQQMLASKPFPIVTIHDDFKCHPNNMNVLRNQYARIMMELHMSQIMENILTQITGKTYPQFRKATFDKEIMDGDYGLS